MTSKREIHLNDKIPGVANRPYFKIRYNGPDYLYRYMQLNNKSIATIKDRLGSGEINRFNWELPKVDKFGDTIIGSDFFHIDDKDDSVVDGDTLVYIGFNLGREHFEFLKEFDNNTTRTLSEEFIWDQLKIPRNIPTNIHPNDKAAGYFFIYSVSKYSKVFRE